ncbi:HD family phosphohydrolase [Hutsoniella sourekii]|uniref:HD family phosphohydrolase n=1 Tax=Hutsoniella sourekii TaxID=87650 RepID=UPI00048575AA|nr:HDIG domain-containing metalloprotein [Hutsoniella sourekii]
MKQMLARLQGPKAKIYFYLVLLALTLVLFLTGYTSVQPQKHDFKINRVSDTTIQAPSTIVDERATEAAQKRAREAVPAAYLYQPKIRDHQLDLLSQLSTIISDIRKNKYSTEDLEAMIESYPEITTFFDQVTFDQDRTKIQEVPFGQLQRNEQFYVYLYEVFKTSDVDLIQFGTSVRREDIAFLIQVNEEIFQQTINELQQLLNQHLDKELEAGELDQLFDELDSEIDRRNYRQEQKDTMKSLLHHLIVPTVVYSQQETIKRQDAAAEAVQPVYILQGQIIVQEGYIIDERAIYQLDLFGLLDSSSTVISLVVFIVFLVLHAGFLTLQFTDFFKWQDKDIPIANYNLTLYSLVVGLGYLVLKGFQIIELSGFTEAMLVFPIGLIILLLYPHIGHLYTLFAVISFNLLSLFLLFRMDRSVSLYLTSAVYLLSSLIILLIIQKREAKRRPIDLYLEALAWHGLSAIILSVVLNLNLLGDQGIRNVSLVIIGVSITFIIYWLVDPHWRSLVTENAPLTLNQLANLNNPLLRHLLKTAPGSYNHSMMVANLSANAVNEIGGNALLARVASYYHDIGKTQHPLFFTENVGGDMESPHTMMTPLESARIIIDHVIQGHQILRDNHMPQSILDICQQHHGTTLVKYFYYQARQGESPVDESDFRYPGPKPQTKEAAIIMIADSVEAASRSLKSYTNESILNLIESIIQDKLDDDQFSDCQLTVNELKIVKESLFENVVAMFHTRVEYPKD